MKNKKENIKKFKDYSNVDFGEHIILILLKIKLNNSNHRRIKFTEKSSQS
ncbi:hypothetical protein [Fusobacterium pseudoperiodonticum]|nr:hypothetical protein [Fusobacterium pseudoperiodonticum]